MSDKLKPCPFCGGQAKLKKGFPHSQSKFDHQAYVQCKKCLCRTILFTQRAFEPCKEVYKQAVETWNSRVEPAFTTDTNVEIKEAGDVK